MGKGKVEVVDREYFLYWEDSECFSTIFKKRVNSILQHRGENVVDVFDGYPTKSNLRSKKNAERAHYSRYRNQLKFCSMNLCFFRC